MRWRVVRSTVPAENMAPYLEAWSRWSGALLTMGIETHLLESQESPGEFVELTRFSADEIAALGDDRLVRIEAELEAAAAEREGSLLLYAPVGAGGNSGGRDL